MNAICQQSFQLVVAAGWEARYTSFMDMVCYGSFYSRGNIVTNLGDCSQTLTCDWPADIKAAHPSLCNPDPNGWPATLGTPLISGNVLSLTGNPSIKFGSGRFNDTVDSIPDASLWDCVLFRMRVDGGASGKHVVLTMAYVYKGATTTRHHHGVPETVHPYLIMSSNQTPWVNSFSQFNNLGSVNQLQFFQLADASGNWVTTFDVAPGASDYICCAVDMFPYDTPNTSVTISAVIT